MKKGTRIGSAGEGTVIVARPSGSPTSGFGFVIVVRHILDGPRIVDTVYGHMRPETCRVRPGQAVSAGDWLADVDTYGGSTGPHLHFEVWPGGWYVAGAKAVNPLPWIS